MKAFIPAAGLGTRLGHLTKDQPKALIKVNGIPLLELTIERLKKKGITQFMVNIHHYGQQVVDFIQSKNKFGVDIEISDERDELLDTGGAIWKARRFFEGNEPVLVHNVDVLSDINLKSLLIYHNENSATATWCVRQRKSGRGLLFNQNMRLIGWANFDTAEYKWVGEPLNNFDHFAYSGIYIAGPGFAEILPFEGSFSIVDAWLAMARSQKIIGYHDESHYWFALGTAEKLKIAEEHLKKINS